jgi:EAL domain-containing protein (putative c-di-GMP-specific phosphodiesterase class I)
MSIGHQEDGEQRQTDGSPQGHVELDALISRAIDPLALMQRVADQALAMIDAADGVLVGLVIDRRALRYVCGSGSLRHFVGEPLALDGSLSGQAIRTRMTLLTSDTETDPRVNRHSTRAFNVRSSVCVPLGRGEQPIGILNVSSASPNAFEERDVELLSGVADFISTVIGTASEFMAITTRLFNARRPIVAGIASPDRAERPEDGDLTGRFVVNVLDPEAARELDTRSRIEAILEQRAYRLLFQPIFDLERGGPFAAEALARFGGTDSPPPDVWFAEAHQVGLGVELELALIEAALTALAKLPKQTVLAVNAGPEALSSPRITEALQRVDPSRVIVELTEHAAVEDYPRLAECLAGLRAAGVSLAIDDAGAGFASLMHIVKLAPDYIKLDRELVSGIDFDPVRRSLANSLMRFAKDTGATLIAEGVETANELAALRKLGIRRAQGFYLARPVPLNETESAARSGAARVRGQAHLQDGTVERAGTGRPAALPG